MAPLEMIYTHIPLREFEQHIVPSIDQLSALYLPLHYTIILRKILRLRMLIEIPNDVEVFASVVTQRIVKSFICVQNMELTDPNQKAKAESGRRIALIETVPPSAM
ncbi:ANM_HP_G0242880.mRNA.1.CDS.1 [Saccharomyces cerevisiae]|nr:ANM_HP_G0242880.mRNA.1.CDS.1 [Saccharomyces cerevisiae]CAI7002497.1 ANM_HP_G0242880.mRNA.1.CDS.1 [Saccharomyces cerevisiae]